MAEDSGHSTDTTLIFLHVPKAGGTTLHKIIARQYASAAVLRCDMQLPGAREDLERAARPGTRGPACVAGHLPYGVHTLLPGPCCYASMLRDPVTRFLSKYYYLRKRPGLVERLAIDPARLDSIESFLAVQQERGALNFQTRLLCGDIDLRHAQGPYPPLPANALAAAQAHITDCFPVLGLLERFEESVLLMARAHHWRRVWFTPRNTNRQRPATDEVPDMVRRRIEEENAQDCRLYRFAEERLRRQVHAVGEELVPARRRLRFYNRCYGIVRGALDRLPRPRRRGRSGGAPA